MQEVDISRLPDELRAQLAEDYQSGCWKWLGKRTKTGYGDFGLGLKHFGIAEIHAHRLIYRLLMGAIEHNHALHHWCHNKRCCNPAHLLPMTNGEHSRWHGERIRRIKETYGRD